MKIKTIFLDRDGVINIEKNYLFKIEDFDFIEGVFYTCKHFIKLGYEIIVVTNQSGIARGYYSLKDYKSITDWMISQFELNNIKILDVFYCPHSPNDHCQCRKPLPGMFLDAQKKYNINMEKSWLIGDSERDITAASLAGIKNTILVRSGHKNSQGNSEAKYHLDSIRDSINLVKF